LCGDALRGKGAGFSDEIETPQVAAAPAWGWLSGKGAGFSDEIETEEEEES